MVYEKFREVIQKATKNDIGIIRIDYKNSDTKEEHSQFYDTYQVELEIQFIEQIGLPDPNRSYTAKEYCQVWKNVKEIVHKEKVKADYDRVNKSAYVNSHTISKLCDKHNAWDIPDGTTEKYFNIDIEVKNNDLLEFVYIYNGNARASDYIEMEIDLRMNHDWYQPVLVPDTTEYIIDATDMKKYPKAKWLEMQRERTNVKQIN